jgi:hypothetical protein
MTGGVKVSIVDRRTGAEITDLGSTKVCGSGDAAMNRIVLW